MRVEERVVSVDVVCLYNFAQLLEELQHGVVVHHIQEFFEQLQLVLHEVRVFFQLLHQERRHFDLIQLKNQTVPKLKLVGSEKVERANAYFERCEDQVDKV